MSFQSFVTFQRNIAITYLQSLSFEINYEINIYVIKQRRRIFRGQKQASYSRGEMVILHSKCRNYQIYSL